MSTQLNSIGWAVIGTPAGFQSKNYGCISQFEISQLVDINNLVIKPFPGSELLCFFREIRNEIVVNYYMLYRHAKEIQTDRSGTFCGSVLVLVGHIAEGSVILKTLEELLTGIQPYLTKDDRFTIPLQQIEVPVPATLDQLIAKAQPVNGIRMVGQSVAIAPIKNNREEQTAILDFFSRPDLSQSFNRLYATSNKDILNYVKARGQLRAIDPAMIWQELENDRLKEENQDLNEKLKLLQKERDLVEAQHIHETNLLKERLQVSMQARQELENKLDNLPNSNTLEQLLRNKETEIADLECQLKVVEGNERNLRAQLRQQQYRSTAQDRSPSGHDNGYREREERLDDPKNKNYHQERSSSRIDNWALSVMRDPKQAFLLVIFFIVFFGLIYLLIGHITWPRSGTEREMISDSRASSDQATRDEQKNEVDSEGLKQKAAQFYASALTQGNVYDNRTLTELIQQLEGVGLNDIDEYNNLKSLLSNYALWNRPAEQVKHISYQLIEDKNTFKDVVEDIYKKYPHIRPIAGFERNLKIYNQALFSTNTTYPKGTKITIYIPISN